MPRLRRAIGGICPSPPQPQEISPYRAVSVPDSAPSAPQTPLQTTRPHARPPIPPPGPPPAPVETPIQPSFYFPDTVPSDASVHALAPRTIGTASNYRARLGSDVSDLTISKFVLVAVDAAQFSAVLDRFGRIWHTLIAALLRDAAYFQAWPSLGSRRRWAPETRPRRTLVGSAQCQQSFKEMDHAQVFNSRPQ